MPSEARFVLYETQKYTPAASPVIICSSRQCRDRRSGVNFLQVRLKNCSNRFVHNVFLTIKGDDIDGECVYKMPEIVLSKCDAPSGALFGEERMIALPEARAVTFRITVERVVFDGGMLWRKDTAYSQLMQAEAIEQASEKAPGKAEKGKLFVPPVITKKSTLLELPVLPKIPTSEEIRTEIEASVQEAQKTVEPSLITQSSATVFGPIGDEVRLMNFELPMQKPAPIVRENFPYNHHKKQKRKKLSPLVWFFIILLILIVTGAVMALSVDGFLQIF